MNDSSLLNLDYHEGSDGPRLMLILPKLADDCPLRQLQECFRNLGEGPVGESLELNSLPWILPINQIHFTLVVDPFDRAVNRIGPSRFEWRRTAESWGVMAQLIEPLLDNCHQAHQYLESTGRDDAIVVVSRGEFASEACR